MKIRLVTSVVLALCFFLLSCGPERVKTPNELRYDSLATVIRDGLPFMRQSVLTAAPPEGRDSMLMMLDDLEDLDYPEIQEKYQLNDSVSERQFLDAISITAQIITAQKKLEEMLRRL